jgi:hypothetical protein
MKKIATQTINGKAFEYSLLQKIYSRLKEKTSVSIIQSAALITAKNCYDGFTPLGQQSFDMTASAAINTLIDLEPRLSHDIDSSDCLQLEILADAEGQSGDVRDVLAIRSLQKWEIGISAKNNHKAVKHSRLSRDIDFGKKWLNYPCSNTYFSEIKIIFDVLNDYKIASESTKKWSSLGNYHDTVYLPILNSFKNELWRICELAPEQAARNLVNYLIGSKDFYKVIKGRKKVEIEAYNLHGTLNQSFKSIKPLYNTKKIKFPDKLIDISFANNSKTTLIVTLNEGWQISFRIHNASSRIEPSLKFDINLVSSPSDMFKHTLSVSN